MSNTTILIFSNTTNTTFGNINCTTTFNNSTFANSTFSNTTVNDTTLCANATTSMQVGDNTPEWFRITLAILMLFAVAFFDYVSLRNVKELPYCKQKRNYYLVLAASNLYYLAFYLYVVHVDFSESSAEIIGEAAGFPMPVIAVAHKKLVDAVRAQVAPGIGEAVPELAMQTPGNATAAGTAASAQVHPESPADAAPTPSPAP